MLVLIRLTFKNFLGRCVVTRKHAPPMTDASYWRVMDAPFQTKKPVSAIINNPQFASFLFVRRIISI
jgi:hypothetical protein